MTTINSLSQIDALGGGDQVPVYDSDAGTARKASLSQFVTYFKSAFASPDVTVTISSPIAGFNQVLPTSTTSQWLILTPAGVLATGTVTLPPVADCFDGQRVLVTSTEAITTLTVAGNGATVNGAPAALATDGFFELRYNTLLLSWFCISQSLGSSFANLEITGAIVDANGNELLAFVSTPAAVNELTITNAATANNVAIDATGTDADIGINITAKGGGGIAIIGDSILLSGTLTTSAITCPSVETFATTVGALGSAVIKGQRKFVTDSNAALTAGIGAVVAGGGANNVPVVSDGTNWRIG